MLQRNAGVYPLILPTLDPPVEVQPGGLLEHPVLLAGFEPASPDHDDAPPLTGGARSSPVPIRTAPVALCSCPPVPSRPPTRRLSSSRATRRPPR